MNLQAILDRFEFRPKPAATLTETVGDLRATAQVLREAVECDGQPPEALALTAALRTSRDRIKTAYGIIEAHGFDGPIVEGTTGRNGEGIDWPDIAATVGGTDQGAAEFDGVLETAYGEFAAADPAPVVERIRADRLALLDQVPDRLPCSTGPDPPARPALRRALLLIAGSTYFLSGFGTHPADLPADANRVVTGFWLVAAVLVGGTDRTD